VITEKEIYEAIEKSIKKWQDIVDLKDNNRGIANCALCQLFHSDISEESCWGCPIEEFVGKRWCKGTPYEEFSKAQSRMWNFVDSARFRGWVINCQMYEAAKKELTFLQQLKRIYTVHKE